MVRLLAARRFESFDDEPISRSRLASKVHSWRCGANGLQAIDRCDFWFLI